MQRNPGVYVRGHIRHPDHATIMLHGWHQVIMNTREPVTSDEERGILGLKQDRTVQYRVTSSITRRSWVRVPPAQLLIDGQ